MSGSKKTALVICPGRGTYNKAELGYLAKYHDDKSQFIQMIDTYRMAQEQVTISELDAAANYSLSTHTRGDNASALIYACAYADFMSIDRDRYDIVAITGNSMGWYVALVAGEALFPFGGMEVINTMGTLMHKSLIGGQLVYPLVDEEWREIPGRRPEIEKKISAINSEQSPDGPTLFISIELGGLLVIAGTNAALDRLQLQLEPEQDRFPMRLKNHAAFHTPLQQPISIEAKEILGTDILSSPTIPLIDGSGHIWRPHTTDPDKLWDYTISQQVVEPYDFSAAIRVGVHEFAPDCLIVLGPGNNLGGAIAQRLISLDWHGLSSKQEFLTRQKTNPFLLSMGLPNQRSTITN